MSLFISPSLSANADGYPNIPLTDGSAFIYTYKSKLGGMVITDYIRQSPRVNIPETLEGEPVVGVDLSKCEKEIVQLIIPDSVKKFALSKTIKDTLGYIKVPKDNIIEAEFFEGYTSLSNIACGDKLYDCMEDFILFDDYSPDEDLPLPVDINYELTIENGVVMDVTGTPTDIAIPYGVTEIAACAFSECKNLTSVTIPDSVTQIGDGSFSDCVNLKSVVVGNGLIWLGCSTFANCESLSTIVLPDSFSNFGYEAFLNCKSLISITIPNKVSDIGDSTFEGCISLKSIVIPDNVTLIGKNAFKGCENLTNVILPNGENCVEIEEGAFSGCTRLSNLTLNSNVTSIGWYAFRYCKNFTMIDIPESVRYIGGGAFADCPNLEMINCPWEHGKYHSIDGILYGIDNGDFVIHSCPVKKKGLVKIPKFVSKISYYAFYDCKYITRVIVPDKVTFIGDYSFFGCENLESINFPNNLRVIDDYSFSGCIKLTNITIPDSVTRIGKDAFVKCDNIEIKYKNKKYTQINIDDLYKAIKGG